MNTKTTIANELLAIEAVKLQPKDPFTWTSGIISPIYCDNRITLSYPKVRKLIVEGFTHLSKEYDFDVVVGVATAGIAHGALLAAALDLPFAYVRSKAKAHGRQNQIEGEIKAGAKALVIEDLISTGGSCIEVVDCLAGANVDTAAVLAIFQYGFSFADKAFKEKNITYKTLSNYDTLIELAAEKGYIASSTTETLKKWQADPKAWNK